MTELVNLPDPRTVEQKAIDILHTIYDPEIPVDIYELGLVYRLEVDAARVLTVTMTLTSPTCPVAESLPRQVQEQLRQLPDVSDVKVDLVWEPPWTMERMSDAAKLALNLL